MRLRKFFLLLIVLAVSLGFFLFQFETARSETNQLEVAFLDVGQGDSTLIKAPSGQNILIDGGPDKSVLRQLGKALPWWDRQIDLVILTHPHDDHLTGLQEVARRYQIKRVLQAGVADDNPNYQSWLRLINNKQLSLVLVSGPQTIELGNGCRLEIIYPKQNLTNLKPQNLNNSSLAVKLIYGDDEILFMGDAETEVEAELLNSEADITADVMKLGHHGSDTSSSEEFLAAVGAKTAVIEVGRDNDFGHPSGRVLKRLERLGVETLRTDLEGEIIFKSRGQGIERVR